MARSASDIIAAGSQWDIAKDATGPSGPAGATPAVFGDQCKRAASGRLWLCYSVHPSVCSTTQSSITLVVGSISAPFIYLFVYLFISLSVCSPRRV